MAWGAAALLLSMTEAGCYDTTVREAPPAVFALFDPAMPTSLSGAPRVPLPSDLTGTTGPADQAVLAPTSAPIDSATIAAGSVIAVDLVTRAPIAGVTARYDARASGVSGGGLLVGPPSTGWPVGHRVAVALRGGGASLGGLGGLGGEPLFASPAFFFARGTTSLLSCADAGTACRAATAALTDEQAQALEPLRLALEPLVMQLAAAGLPREQLALAWTFTVTPALRRADGGAGRDGAF